MNAIRVTGAFIAAATLAGAGMPIPPMPPVNDDFPGTTVSGTPVDVLGSNVGATRQSGEPNPFSVSSRSVWWSWTAPWSGPFIIHTEGSDFDTTVGVYTGDSVDFVKRVAENDEGPLLTSKVAISANSGTVYRIQVNGAYGATGNIQLHIQEFIGTLPSNDDFPGPWLSGTTSTSGSNENATAQEGEPNPVAKSGCRSVWYTWEPPGPGKVVIDTTGSSFDTILGVYTGSDLTDLQMVRQNHDLDPPTLMQSQVQFSTNGNNYYRIMVNGYDGATGTYNLKITFTESSSGNWNWGAPAGACGLMGIEAVLAMALLRLMRWAAPH